MNAKRYHHATMTRLPSHPALGPPLRPLKSVSRRQRWIARVALILALVVLQTAAAKAPSSPPATDWPRVANDAPVEREWLRVLLGGRRIGVFEIARRSDGAIVETVESMRLLLDRNGSSVPLESRTTSIERVDGTPLAFRSESRLSGHTQLVEGRVIALRVAEIVTTGPGGPESRILEWQPGAVLVKGAEAIARRHALEPGTRWRHVSFDMSGLEFIPIESHVIGREIVDVFGQRRELVRINQHLSLPGSELTINGWHTEDHALVRALMPMFGLELELIACESDCSAEPIQGLDLFEHSLVASPRPLSRDERRRPLVHHVEVLNGKGRPPSLTGQRVETVPGGFRITVDPIGWVGGGVAPTAADTARNRWIEADDPLIRRAAIDAVGDASDATERMRRLTAFVRTHVTAKTLDVGYASARETLDARAGDCTEHALLLAALARALGIPARVVSGLAYTPHWAGRNHVFVPHAWALAWTGSRWEAFDAALPDGFGSGHLALADGDGEPSTFYAAVGLLGNLRIATIETVPEESR